MLRIVPLIASLQQHLSELERAPAAYRPPRCPHCGFARLWNHGHYKRKADRGSGVLNPIPVPRFVCRGCRVTCSVVPSCLPPRRWYAWSVQAAVLLSLLSGTSLRECADTSGCARSTVRRWWQWLQQRHEQLAFHLRSHWPEWGRAGSWQEFWQAALAQEPLREVMAWLDRQGVVVP
jgi:transposase-like protein